MGKQIGLALTKNDLEVFELVLKAGQEAIFIADHIDPVQRKLELLPTIAFDSIEESGSSVFCFITLREFVNEVVIKKHSDIKYAIDVEASWVVELWRPLLLSNGRIRPGRLYYEPMTRKDGQTRPKDAVFIRWADSVLVRARRSLARDMRTGLFVGIEAGAAMAAGHLIAE